MKDESQVEVKSKETSKNAGDIIDCNVYDVKIEDIVPNVIDNVVVVINGGVQDVFLPDDMSGLQFRNWQNGRGGVFAKDVLNHTRGLKTGKYVIAEHEGSRIIARLIDDDELLKFEVSKIVDGTIKDRPCMVLREVPAGQNLTSTKNIRKINYVDVDILAESDDVDVKDSPNNVPLFND